MSDASPEMMSIFCKAVDLASPEERAAYLQAECGDNNELRERMQALLRAHNAAGGFLPERPADSALAATNVLPEVERPGAQIGPYKLLQQVGEGGMGVVYMAEQSEPVQRRVALKIIKPGMDSRQVVARFEAERQALAMMDHPHIAKVFEAGTTDSGRPYFVMELVKGVPITKYCDTKRLSLKERLELLIPVCQAIQHAHQKGIIHRDIKPNNVLVAQYDGAPVPKVIDFGVAKATAQKLTERTMFTELGQIVGTLEYMSPEQAELNQLDIDTRSDIYSLGVLLYELLTGSTPFDKQKLRTAAFDEMLRIIREEEPPKPSTNLSSSDTLPAIAANRNTNPTSLSKTVRGELDWIVMKALEKDRNRRYETANGLAMDIQRYLNDEHVLACPPSAVYRLRKFVRRNKGSVLAVLAVFVTLLAGIIGTSWGMLRAGIANSAEREAKRAALTREAESRAVLEFVESKIFAAIRPEGQDGGLGYQVTLREALDAAVPYIKESLTDQPLVEAQLRMTMGTSYSQLGEHELALEQYARAHLLYTRHLEPEHTDTLASMDNLASTYRLLDRPAEALRLHEKTLTLLKRKNGPNDLATLGCQVNTSIDYHVLGREAEGAELLESALAILNLNYPNHDFTLNCLANLATSYHALGEYAKSLELREKILPLAEARYGSDHPSTLTSMSHLAASYDLVGKHENALTLYEKVFDKRANKIGPEHADTVESMSRLASVYGKLGRYADALKHDERALAIRQAKLPKGHPAILQSMSNVATCYQDLDRFEDALILHEETLKLLNDKRGADHIDTLGCQVNVAIDYKNLGRADEALKLNELTLVILKRRFPVHQFTLNCLTNLANSYWAEGRLDDAIRLSEEKLVILKKKFNDDHIETLMCMVELARDYQETGRDADALKLTEQVQPLIEKRLGPKHPQAVAAANRLAWMLANSPKPKPEDVRRAVELAKEAVKHDPENGPCHNTLGVAQYRAGEWQDAITSLEMSRKLQEGGDVVDLFFLAMAHSQLKQNDEAEKWFGKAVKWMKENEPESKELNRFYAEAAELLRRKEEQPTTIPTQSKSDVE